MARDGFEALMAGKDHVIAGSGKNKAQVAGAKLLPEKATAGLHAAVNYYRAAVRANPLAQAQTLRRVDIPTLVIWRDQDRYLGRELAEPDHAWVPEVRVERIPLGLLRGEQGSPWINTGPLHILGERPTTIY